MVDFCACCGQRIENLIWDRAAADQAEKDLRDHLRRLLGDEWQVTSDNGITRRNEDQWKLEIVVHALIRHGAHIDGTGCDTDV